MISAYLAKASVINWALEVEEVEDMEVTDASGFVRRKCCWGKGEKGFGVRIDGGVQGAEVEQTGQGCKDPEVEDARQYDPVTDKLTLRHHR